MLFLVSCAPLWDNCNAWNIDECMISADGTISAKSDSPSQNQPRLYTIVGEDAFTLHLIWYLISRIYPIRSYIFTSYKIDLYIVSRCFQLKKTLLLSFNLKLKLKSKCCRASHLKICSPFSPLVGWWRDSLRMKCFTILIDIILQHLRKLSWSPQSFLAPSAVSW